MVYTVDVEMVNRIIPKTMITQHTKVLQNQLVSTH